MRGLAHRHRHQTVVQGHFGCGAVADRRLHRHVLAPRRAVVRTVPKHLGRHVVGPNDLFFALEPPVLAQSDAHHTLRDESLGLAGVADERDFLFVLGGFGEHAQVQRRARAVREVDDHQGIVKNVGHSTVVPFIQVVHVLCARGVHAGRLALQQQPHQVEEVTALLHERSTRVRAETVPVAHLDEKRKPVFANAEHAQPPEHTVACVCEQAHRRRHVPVLETDPHHAARHGRHSRRPFELDDLATLRGRDAQRLFDQEMRSVAKQRLEHAPVCVIRACDYRNIEAAGGHEVFDRAMDGDGGRLPEHAASLRQAGLVRVAQRHDFGRRQRGECVEVLDAHHPRADDGVTKR